MVRFLILIIHSILNVIRNHFKLFDIFKNVLYNILTKINKVGDFTGKDNKKFNEKYLEQNGVDAEEVKEEYVDDSGHYDIYNGETITIESKDGRDVVDTGMS